MNGWSSSGMAAERKVWLQAHSAFSMRESLTLNLNVNSHFMGYDGSLKVPKEERFGIAEAGWFTSWMPFLSQNPQLQKLKGLQV